MLINLFRTRCGQEIAVSALCDGGDQGCGGGLLLLMLQAMKRLEVGAVLEVRSTDLGVREDLPAWCRMTGNHLLAEQEGEQRNRYFVQKGGA
ncbi:MAG TPA: sulfurtransferase TusA family protein [Ktedonosporobacter sp.]|nr:sulfurtransferase TusA family protein [Ktedonosporobacter sp.]